MNKRTNDHKGKAKIRYKKCTILKQNIVKNWECINQKKKPSKLFNCYYSLSISAFRFLHYNYLFSYLFFILPPSLTFLFFSQKR